jgi:hypothetical protein
VPLLEISPYYAPDFSGLPLKTTGATQAAYCRLPLRRTPGRRVVSISPARNCVIFAPPEQLHRAIEKFLEERQ